MELTIKGKELNYNYSTKELEEVGEIKIQFCFSKQGSLIMKGDYRYYEILDAIQVLDTLENIGANTDYSNLVDIKRKEQEKPEVQSSKPINQ